jgi:hypothetical protein
LTNDKIIKEVIAEEKDNSRNNDDKGWEAIAVQTIIHSTTIDSFTMPIT